MCSSDLCGKFYIAGVYTSRDSRVNQNDIWKEFDKSKVKFINVNGFNKNLSFTEYFITNSLGLYKFWGICIKNRNQSTELKLAFPGYATKQIIL